MDLVKLLTREESIAGIEISDTHVRVALLRASHDKTETYNLEYFGEEALEKGVITEGIITNEPALLQAIRTVLKKSKKRIRYVVASLPASLGFYKTFSFPKNIPVEKQEEGMRIASEFQLPLSKDQIYVDWEKINGIRDNTTEQILVAGNKEKIDTYNSLLVKLKLHVIAIETHPLSIARILQISETPELFIIQETTDTALMIVQNGSLRFVRTLPKIFFDNGGNIKEEVEHVLDFFEVEYGIRPKVREIKTIRLGEQFSSTTKELISGDMCAVAGAALRGALPRNTDTEISLIPVGTEEAYELEKAKAFATFILNISIAVMIFFIVAYIGAWLIMVQIQHTATNRFAQVNNTPAPEGAAEFETRAIRLNNYLDVSDAILTKSPRWSFIIGSLSKLVPQGVKIHTISLPAYNSQFSIAGVAASRPILNGFRSTLETSSIFSGVTLPLSNLDKTGDIPFSMTFSLKEPELYLLSHYAQ